MDRLQNATLIEMVKEHAVKHGKFPLSSGEVSDYFIDLSKITNRSDGLDIITQTILHWFEYEAGWCCHAVGGPTLGAAPLVGGLMMAYHRNHYGIGMMTGFLVRKEPKNGELIEGVVNPGDNVLIVEDVVTTGKQVQRTVEIVESFGGNVKGIIAVVDRLQGAKELLGDRFRSMMTIQDLGL